MSIKIVLRKRPNKDGTRPLILQMFRNDKASTVHLGYHLREEDWDAKNQRVRKSHPNSARLNSFLAKKLAEAHNNALELEVQNKDASSQAVVGKMKRKSAASFFAQADDYLKALKESGKYNQYAADKPRIGRFRQYLDGKDISFTEITPGLLEKFAAAVSARRKPGDDKATVSRRTVVNHLVVVRSVFAHARKNKIIGREQTPFGGDGVKIKIPETHKMGLALEDLEKLESVSLSDPRHDHARKLWLFSFYFAGMRVSDVLRLKWSDIKQGRLYYAMGKNDKAVSLKIPDKALAILQHYEAMKEKKDDYIFPELKGMSLTDKFNLGKTISFKTKYIDKILRLDVAPAAGIDKSLTMHIARHTFAGLAGDAIPIQMLQKLYRHSNVTTTIGYQRSFTTKDADEALEAVINKRKNNAGVENG